MSETSLLIYGAAKESILRGTLPLTAAFRVVLLTANYTPLADTHATWADAQNHQVIGAGYVFGGKPFPGPTTITRYDNAAWLNIAAPVIWPGCSFDAKWVVVVRSDVADLLPENPLLGYADIAPGQDFLALRAGILELRWPANTVLTLR